MQRRDVLCSCGLLAAGAVAGCGGSTVDGDGGEPSDGERTDDETPAETRTTAATVEPAAVAMGEPELSVGGTDCLSGDQGATVAFGDGRVTVEGTVTAPDPCHEPVLGASGYDEGADVLSLTVDAVEDAETDRVCATCTGGLQYSVVVPFEGGLPGRVRVDHGGMEPRSVADATREA